MTDAVVPLWRRIAVLALWPFPNLKTYTAFMAGFVCGGIAVGITIVLTVAALR